MGADPAKIEAPGTPGCNHRVHLQPQGTLGTSGACTVLFQVLRPHWLVRGVFRDCLLVVKDDCGYSIFKGEISEREGYICEDIRFSDS